MQPVHFFKMMLEVTDVDASERFYRDDLGPQTPESRFSPRSGKCSELLHTEVA